MNPGRLMRLKGMMRKEGLPPVRTEEQLEKDR